MSFNMIMEYNLNLQRKFSAQSQSQNVILLTDMPELIWELHNTEYFWVLKS